MMTNTIGWQSYAGCAIAWNAAGGGIALAHDFALGGLAQAIQANNQTASDFLQSLWFFRISESVIPCMAWLDLLWIVPLFAWWRAAARKAAPAA